MQKSITLSAGRGGRDKLGFTDRTGLLSAALVLVGMAHPSECVPATRARRTGKFDFTYTIRFAVRIKFSLTENLMKKHRGGALRARVSALFEQRY